jgi:hypothetical protein
MSAERSKPSVACVPITAISNMYFMHIVFIRNVPEADRREAIAELSLLAVSRLSIKPIGV